MTIKEKNLRNTFETSLPTIVVIVNRLLFNAPCLLFVSQKQPPLLMISSRPKSAVQIVWEQSFELLPGTLVILIIDLFS